MEKELPIIEDPFIETYNNLAQPLSFLLVTESEKILQNIFLNLDDIYWLNGLIFFDSRPFYEWECIRSEKFLLSDFKNEDEAVLNTIHSYIDKNMYAYIILNEKYIPNRAAYQDVDYYHDNLIYGYDDSQVYTIAYNERKYYKKCSISNNDLLMGIKNTKKCDEPLLIFCAPDKSFEIMPFDSIKEIIISQIKRYLNSENRHKIIFAGCHYGISIYDQFIEQFEDIENFLKIQNLRPFRLFLEHKKLLQRKLDYINKGCYKPYACIESQINKIYLFVIKLLLTKDVTLVCKIKEAFARAKEDEIKVLKNFLNNLGEF